VVSHAYHFAPGVLAPNTNLLRFPASVGYELMHVYRTDPGYSGFGWVAAVDVEEPPFGLYADTGLVNGFPYAYYLVAEGMSGARTAKSAVFSGTPRAEADPPLIGLTLAHGSSRSNSRVVTATVNASPDASRLLISANPLFSGATWRPYTREVSLELGTGLASPFTTFVYAKVRDAAGNESIVDVDGITVDDGCTCSLPGRPRTSSRGVWALVFALGALLRRRRRSTNHRSAAHETACPFRLSVDRAE
jgi:hypothetical protein